MYFHGPTAGELLFALALFAAVFIGIGWGVNELIEWAWPIVKSWLHALTA